MAKDAAAAAAPAPDKRKLPKLILPLTADRRVALDKMPERNRERLRLVISDSQLREQLALPAAPPTTPADSGFPFKYVDPILQILCSVAALLGVQVGERTGWFDPETVIALVVFNGEERKELAQPVADAIAYNWPGLLSESNPNVALALALGAIVQKKLQARAAMAAPPASPSVS